MGLVPLKRMITQYRFLVNWILIVVPFVFLETANAKLSESKTNEILWCYQNVLGSLPNNKEKYKKVFDHFPKNDFYKLFIDKARLESPDASEKSAVPHLLFDVKEPGYHDGMMRGFQTLSESMDKKVDLKLLIQLHDSAVKGVFADPQKKRPFALGVSSTYQGFGYPHKTVDPEAFRELFEGGILYNPKVVLDQLSPGYLNDKKCIYEEHNILMDFYDNALVDFDLRKSDQIWSKYNSEAKVKEVIQPFLDHYYSQIGQVHSLKDKLRAIAELVRTLEVAHFFLDGNQRTYAFLLLNRLLIENNIPPVILDDPAAFDGYMTLENLVILIQSGISNYLNENQKNHERFFDSHCKTSNSSLKSSYFTSERKYTPIFEKTDVSLKVKALREKLSQEVTSAIASRLPNQRGPSGYLPLHLALILKNTDSIRSLMKQGANPFEKLQPNSFQSVVTRAIALDKIDELKMMLDEFHPDEAAQDNLQNQAFSTLRNAIYLKNYDLSVSALRLVKPETIQANIWFLNRFVIPTGEGDPIQENVEFLKKLNLPYEMPKPEVPETEVPQS